MKRLAPFALLGLLATPVQALDLTNMSEDERAAFRDEVRAYLLDNPQVIMEAVALLEERTAQAQEVDDLNLVKGFADDIFDDGFSWVGGNPDGDVTVVEFLDYRCGYCRKAFEEVNTLIEKDQNIRFIVKELPILGQASTDSSRFAIATKQVAGDDAYAAMHDALMEYKGPTSDDALSRLAKGLGIDPEPIVAHLGDPAVEAEISKTRALAQNLRINGTPTFIFGDQMIRGYVPLDAMTQILAEQRDG